MQEGHRKGRKRPSNLREQVDTETSQMWPTPRARDHFPPMHEKYVTKNKSGYITTRKKTGVRYGASLPDAINFEEKTWPTPRTSGGSRPNGKGGKVLDEEVKIAEGLRIRGKKLVDHKTYPTPRANSGMTTKLTKKLAKSHHKKNLETEIAHELHNEKIFLTPSANEDAAGKPTGKMQKMLGNDPDVRNTGKGVLNADWVELLMGYQQHWTDLEYDKPIPKTVEPFWNPNWESNVPRVTTNKKHRAARLKGLGNAIVPQVARQIGLAIQKAWIDE